MKPVSIKILIIACLSALLAGCGGQRHAAKIERPEDDRVPAITVATPKQGIDPQVAKALEREARSWLGVKYRYGGETRKGTDCSGLVM
ncbi:MAG: C40 family peptidase, partial [Muribaculaceae bacterium]|nr:C40 family peptidase [Muribaculaceae bacterium]